MPSAEEIATWDAEADQFDEAADHGLRDEAVRDAWRDLLLRVLPSPPARVADLGCGTGTLSVLLAEAGYEVDGLDFSPRMIELARAKAAGHEAVRFVRGDAYQPSLPVASFDAVLCRHVLWAMPDPAVALRRWLDLLVPSGRVVLVEGRWHNGAGLSADQTVRLVAEAGLQPVLTRLRDPAYWGRPIEDDRYLVASAQSRGAGPTSRRTV